ncbi:unnamed protein product [Rhodiola kirilowii]
MADAMKIKPFDGTSDFSMWKMRMKASLVKEKCYRAVTKEWIALTSDQQKIGMKELAYSEIMMRLIDNVSREVMHHSEPKTLWDELDKMYLVKSLPNRISLQTKLFTFMMDVSMSLQENLDIFLKLTQDLKKCKDEIKEEHLYVILLNSIPSQFDTLRDVIQYGSEEVTVSKIIQAITSKNDSLKVFKTKNGVKTEVKSEVMMFKGKNKFKPKKKNHNGPQNNNDSHGKNSLDKPSQSYFQRNTLVKCNYCGKLGHYASSCYKIIEDKKNKEKDNQQSGQSNICENDPQYENELFLMSGNHEDDSWILDSSCTMHATPHKHLFSSLKLCEGGEVMLGDHTSLKIKGIGSVPLRMFDGVVRTLQNVRWVPHLRRIVMSESALDKLGCKITTFKGVREVMRDNRIVMRSIEKGG